MGLLGEVSDLVTVRDGHALFCFCRYIRRAKFVADVDKNITSMMSSPGVGGGQLTTPLPEPLSLAQVTPNCRVALRNDSYTLHKILPNKVTHWCP